ncbi:MAG: hypothetical protein LUG16_01490, partial [Candidatus Gastranaerophilales bacterium]|nr:hypothetical protein [Candidatus Gastranaerophilales bacterium]
MNNITTGYNPFLREVKRTDTKLININKNKSVSSSSIKDDTFYYAGNKETKALRQDFEKIKSQQGIIGKAWDGIKNLFGMKSGSKKVEEVIKQAEKGEITTEEAKERIKKYEDGQKMCVDVAADMASGIVAVGAFALAVPTGGASLAVGLAAATAAGAGVKIGIKAGDAVATGKEYNKKDLLYDFATGAVNGLFAPITNGIGASLTKTLGKKLGLKVVEEGAKEVAGQGIKQAAKSVILTQSVDVIGGTIGQRALALGAGMAVDGALGGASDNMVRAALNGENVIEAGIQGAVGGAIAAPVIGGGFRIAGKAGHALNNKITTKLVLPDGLNTKFKQGEIGDCALLSTIDGMLNNPSSAQNLKKSITKTAFGDYNVKIGDEIVHVAKSSLTDEMLSDTTGIRIFEQAYKQISGDIDGGFAETVAKQFGLNPVHITNDTITDELLDKIAKEQNNTVLSLGTLIDTDGNISSNGAHRHYFTIKDIDADTKTVKITSPYDTSKTIELSYDDVKSLGISIDGGSLKETDLPNIARNIDDEVFKGIDISSNREKFENSFNCTEEEINNIIKESIQGGSQYNLDSIIANLELNDISVDDFIKLVNKNLDGESFEDFGDIAISEALKSLTVYKNLTHNNVFDGFKLSLEEIDELYPAITEGDVNKIYEILSNNNSEIAKAFKQNGIIENNISTIYSSATDSGFSAINPDNIVDIGEINGKNKKIFFPDGTTVSHVKSDINSSDLIKSNLMTMDLIDLCTKNNIELPDGKIRITPEYGDAIKLDVSIQEIAEKAQNSGIDSLSSQEIHALTDTFDNMYNDNSSFKKQVENYIKQNQSKFNNIYN